MGTGSFVKFAILIFAASTAVFYGFRMKEGFIGGPSLETIEVSKEVEREPRHSALDDLFPRESVPSSNKPADSTLQEVARALHGNTPKKSGGFSPESKTINADAQRLTSELKRAEFEIKKMTVKAEEITKLLKPDRSSKYKASLLGEINRFTNTFKALKTGSVRLLKLAGQCISDPIVSLDRATCGNVPSQLNQQRTALKVNFDQFSSRFEDIYMQARSEARFESNSSVSSVRSFRSPFEMP